MTARAELVALFQSKARQDLLAATRLSGMTDVADEVVGFHLQQAIEKLLKALLTHLEVPFRRTHDLLELLDLLREAAVVLPEGMDALQEMTPFAVDYRYESFGTEEEPLDRERALAQAEELSRWVAAQLS